MATATEREFLREARERLDEWVVLARDEAYAELFEGPDAVLTAEEIELLDRIDSELSRQGDVGLWGADEYGVVTGFDEDEAPRVVCTYHPEIVYEAYRGEGSLRESTREELNDVLWEYCERVASRVQEDLDAFARRWHSEREAS